jgi:chorismate synthase
MKYGPADDAIGAGIFSGRYTSTIVAAGYVAKKILSKFGIEICAYVKELAGIECPETSAQGILKYCNAYKQMRMDYDPFYQEIYVKGRINQEMRFLEKMAIFAQVEKEIDDIRSKTPEFQPEKITEKYNVHHILNCPDIKASDEMVATCNRIAATGDSVGGIVEVLVKGVPAGMGEPIFSKLDAEFGRLMGIGAVKGVEVGAGFAVRDMTGYESNDRMHSEDGKVVFDSNNAGGITGGLTTGQNIVVRLAVKPTPTIDKKQHTIDKYTKENKDLEAITRRDPTIVARIWPVAENFTALIILDNLFMHLGYQKIKDVIAEK